MDLQMVDVMVVYEKLGLQINAQNLNKYSIHMYNV